MSKYRPLAMDWTNALAAPRGMENLHRIVACVNACEGLENPAAFVQAAMNLADAAKRAITSSGTDYKPELRQALDAMEGAMKNG